MSRTILSVGVAILVVLVMVEAQLSCSPNSPACGSSVCCTRPAGDRGCCPFVNGACCASGTHCCPAGYSCGLGNVCYPQLSVNAGEDAATVQARPLE